MPILRENNVLKPRRDFVDQRNLRVSARNGKFAAGAEIVLYVDHKEYVVGSDIHKLCSLPLSQMNLTMANPSRLCQPACLNPNSILWLANRYLPVDRKLDLQ